MSEKTKKEWADLEKQTQHPRQVGGSGTIPRGQDFENDHIASSAWIQAVSFHGVWSLLPTPLSKLWLQLFPGRGEASHPSLLKLSSLLGLPRWLSGKEPTCQAGDSGSLDQEDPLEEEMATHSSILA